MSPETATFFGQWILPIGGLICLGILFFPKLRAHMQAKKEKEKCDHRGAPMKIFAHVPCVDGNHQTMVSVVLCRTCGEAVPFCNIELADKQWLRDLRVELTIYGFGLASIPDPDILPNKTGLQQDHDPDMRI